MHFIKTSCLLFFIFIVIFSVIISGCTLSDLPQKIDSDKNFSILCTSYPQYDWVKNIIADVPSAEVSILFKNGVDAHSFQPSAEDIVKISNCDLFIYTGGQSDKDIEEIILNSNNPDIVVLNLMNEISDRLLCVTHNNSAEEGHNHSDISLYDEHICLSLKNAEILCKKISETISSMDTENANTYIKNSNNYISELKSLDEDYLEVVSSSSQKSLVFADRYPFRYLFFDYEIECFSAFPGCSAETDASFDTILDLSSKVDELNLNYVLIIEGNSTSVADSVIANTKNKNADILCLNSMQSITGEEIEGGMSYLSVMKSNFNILRQALN